MKGIHGPKLPRWHRFGLTLVLGAAWGTGLTLLWARYFGRHEGPLGPETHWLESPARTAHGLAIFLVLLALGTLVPSHFQAGWRTGTRRRSALAMAGTAATMILTGWGLYYASNESFRQGLSWTHSALGLLLFPLFFLHSRRRPSGGSKNAP